MSPPISKLLPKKLPLSEKARSLILEFTRAAARDDHDLDQRTDALGDYIAKLEDIAWRYEDLCK